MNDFRVQASFRLLADSVADGQIESRDMLTTRARGYTYDASRPSGLDSTLTDRCLHAETLAPRRSGRYLGPFNHHRDYLWRSGKARISEPFPRRPAPGGAPAPAPAHAREPEKT